LKLQIYKTLWGHTGTLALALSQAKQAGFDGIEGPAPETVTDALQMKNQLSDSGLGYIAEITTAGTYVPDRRASLQQHVDSFALKLEQSMRLDPVFITCLGGCDAWEEDKNIAFFIAAIDLANSAGVTVSFETHRSRAFFNPWVTERITSAIPEMRLTCDFSHWCVVCERLLDSELELIERLAPKTMHIHARVGYDQGPQVPDPRLPRYLPALDSHRRWWREIWDYQRQRGLSRTTLTPEFGPDGYQQLDAMTGEAVGDLWEINCWMAQDQRDQFEQWRIARTENTGVSL
jgi:sugar phosphate isomerase/epimerase